MKKEPYFMWNEECGRAVCTIYYKDKTFCGSAECSDVDRDFMSERTGTHIAYIRAYIDYLKYVRDCEQVPRIDALTHYYGTMKHSNSFNEKSYEAKRLFKEIQNAEEDLNAIRELISINRKDLQLYLSEKDKFYKNQRAKKAKEGQNS